MIVEPVSTARNFPYLIEACADEIVIPPPTPTNFGIIKPRLLYHNGFDTGKHQSFFREFNNSTADSTNDDEDWEWISSGGANNSGFLRSKKRLDNKGQFSILPAFSIVNTNLNWPHQDFGNVESQIGSADMLIKINLFGQILSQPMNFAAFYSSIIFTITPQVVLQLLPDNTIQAVLVSSGPIYTPIGPPSTIKIDPTQWQGINWQAGISKDSNDLSGFVIVNLHRDDTDYEGVNLLDLQFVKTKSDNNSDCINAYGFGTEVVPNAGPGVNGIGFDDYHISGNYGTVKKMFGTASVDKLLPVATGDTSESFTSFDGRITSPASNGPTIIGIQQNWSSVDRIQNLLGVGLDLDAYIDRARSTGSRTATTPRTATWFVGWTSAATGNWVTGPWGFDTGHLTTDNPVGIGPFNPPQDLVKRNSFYTGNLGVGQKELYKLQNPRSDALIIIGASVFSITSNADLVALVSEFANVFWSTTSPRADFLEDFNHVFNSIIKINGIETITRKDFTDFVGLTWVPAFGYMREPWSMFIADNLSLQNIQAGIQQNLDIVDQKIADFPGNGYTRYSKVDLVQLGVEYSWRTREPSLLIVPDSSPLAKLIITFISIDNRNITIRNASVAWNSNIVSSIIDWGDNSSTEELDVSPRLDPGSALPFPTLSHVYLGGTFNIKMTVTDDAGKVSTDTITIIVPFKAPTASFTSDGNPGSSFINFSDASTDPDNDIVSYLWDFGDGNTSNIQNPSHNYVVDGTFTVSLTVTDAHGLSNTTSSDITVPLPLDLVGCPLSTIALQSPCVAGVQADDYNNGNPRFPASTSKSVLQSYYWDQVPFRALYENALINDINDFDIDTSDKFYGHNVAIFYINGPGYGAWSSDFSSDTTNLSDDSDFSDFPPSKIWHRLVYKLSSDLMTAANAAVNVPDGFTIIGPSGFPHYTQILTKNNHLYLCMQTREVTGGAQITRNIDLGDVGTAQSDDWYETILYSEIDGGANTLRQLAWHGSACLGGASPITDQTKPHFPLSVGGQINFTQTDFLFMALPGSGTYTPKPFIKVGLIEQHHGFNLASNPFNVALS